MDEKEIRHLSNLFWERLDCRQRPGAQRSRCCFCDGKFIRNKKKGWEDTPVVVAERKNDWFRGNDSVFFAHPECCSKNKIRIGLH